MPNVQGLLADFETAFHWDSSTKPGPSHFSVNISLLIPELFVAEILAHY